MAKKILLRGDTKANWLSVDPVLYEREVVIETDGNLFKVGDGVKKYSELPYINEGEPLGGIAFDATAPEPGRSGKYIFTTSGSCAWLTGGSQNVNISDEILVIYDSTLETYTYTLLSNTSNFEPTTNKKTTLTDSDTDYPTTRAVNTGLALKADHGYEEGETVKTVKEVEDDLGQNMSDMTKKMYGEESTLKTYWDELGYGIGSSVYKSDTILIETGVRLDSIKYYARNAVGGYLYILNGENKILNKISISPNIGWNTQTIGNIYNEDTTIAVSGADIRFSHSTTSKEQLYSHGLFEGANTENAKEEGETMVFAHNVPERYYEFSIEVNTTDMGFVQELEDVDENIASLDSRISSLEIKKINLATKKNPVFVNTKEEGYSLFGRWYSFSTFPECCNCGGQSIIAKVKGATNVVVDITQTVHPSHPDWIMAEEPFIAWSIDGGVFTREHIGHNISIPIADTDEHLLWIVVDGMCLYSGSANRNSGWSGVHINSISTDGKIYKVKARARQILFVGDSIVEGINTLGTTSISSTNSALNGFSFKTAQKLNALPLLQGYGGTTSWEGLSLTRYSWVDGESDDFLEVVEPDIICVEYGYNDNSVIDGGTKTKEYFIESYTTLINVLRGKYSGVPIVCIIPFKQSLAEEIRGIAMNFSFCYVVETSGYDVTYSDQAHPNVAGAESIALSLAEDIQKIFGKAFFLK